MKHLVTAFLLAFGLAVSAAAEAPSGDDGAAVKAVLQSYKQAIENLDGEAASALFATDARIFEQGGDEGTWAFYLEHHLGPEFSEIKSFKFSDYEVDVQVSGDLAIASETYRYRIELPETAEPIVRLGAATSVLRRTADGWKIFHYHSSSRKTGN